MKFIFSLLVLSFVFVMPVFGDLTWKNTKVELDAKSTDPSATGVYHFQNETDAPIKITTVKTSCGCTTAKLDKKIYAPGESGQITAHFDIGSRLGLQTKSITVTTNDAPDHPTVLELSVNIPDIIETSNPQLTWKIGDKPSAQIFSVKATQGYKVKIVEIRTSTSKFSAAIASAKEGEAYNVSVTPASTDSGTFALLIVTTDYPTANPRVVYAKLQVK